MKSENKPLRIAQNLKSKSLGFLGLFSMLFFSIQSFATIHEGGDYDAGETLFNNICASCHSVKEGNVVAAPSLFGVSERWDGKDELIELWIQNPQKAFASGDPYIIGMVNQSLPKFGWMQGQSVNAEEIKHIFTYVSEYKGIDETPVDDKWKGIYDPTVKEAEASNPVFWFLILAVVLAIIAVAASGAGRAIDSSILEKETGTGLPHLSYGTRVKNWMWNNKVVVSLLSLFVIGFFLTKSYIMAMDINVMQDYEPDQPIAFNHKLHAGKNGINCQYCHNSAAKSKHAGLPEPMLCMNCHKGVKEGHNDEMTAEIQKIYDYVGFDPATASYIDDYEQKPITWNKVHNLPDHVYFNHSQHVNVAGLECQNCHGPVDTEYMLGKVATSAEIMKLAESDPNIISLEKDVLTMGWCIECHSKAGVSVMNSENGYYQEIHDRLLESDLGKRDLKKYLEDNTITVKELGGWECSKCHY